MLLGWVLARFESYLALGDSCSGQEQRGCGIWGARAVFAALAGGEKMDPGEKKRRWLPLIERFE